MATGFPIIFGKSRYWTPAQLQTAIWLDASDSSTITLNGINVSQWNDKSGNGRNATQSTAANQPLYGTNTNYLKYSEQLNNAVWTKQTNVTVSADAVVAPDGTTTADAITWTTASNATGIYQSITDSFTDLTSTRSIWIRADVAGGTVDITDPVYSSGTLTATLSTSWQRVEIALSGQTTAAGIWIKKTASSPNTIYLWGAQLNIGDTATTYQKTTNTSIIITGNGYPVVSYDGIASFMNLDGTFLANTDYSVFFCAARGSGKSNNYVVAGNGNVANTNLMLGWMADTSLTYENYANGGNITVPAYSRKLRDLVSATNTNGVGRRLYANGTLGLSLLYSAITSLTTWSTGKYITSYYLGDICELIVLSYGADTTTRQKIEGYLAWKWGLEGSLPSTHPYKLFPPTA